MKHRIFYYEVVGLIVTLIIGTFSHFTYEWTGNQIFVGLFCPVNESVWEHLKLVFFPFFLYSLLEYFLVGKRFNNYWFHKSISVILGCLFIVLGFYVYTIVLNDNLILDLILFVVAVVISFLYGYKWIRRNRILINYNWLGVLLLLILIIAFIICSITPPEIGIFEDPHTLTYGIQ